MKQYSSKEEKEENIKLALKGTDKKETNMDRWTLNGTESKKMEKFHKNSGINVRY
jgi:hypothetical protein|tara:strand:+ start:401 stop:565 length:165 start_codon:yes stop_codon:yes gene_type:complete